MDGIALDEQSVATMPRAEAFATAYDELLDLASDHLTEPVSATIDTWEDGEFRIRVYHQIPPDEREVLYYHSSEPEVRYAIQSDDSIRGERVVATIDAGATSKK